MVTLFFACLFWIAIFCIGGGEARFELIAGILLGILGLGALLAIVVLGAA